MFVLFGKNLFIPKRYLPENFKILLIINNSSPVLPPLIFVYFFFFNWDSLHERLKSHYEAWSYKKKKSTENITGYSKSV